MFAVSAIYLSYWVSIWYGSPCIFVLAIAMFSPMSTGWSRAILAELLSSAAVMWVFAELIRCFLQKHFCNILLTLALCTAMLIRWEQICLLVPIAVALTLFFGYRVSIPRTALITAICGIPYLALVTRAAIVGLPLLPPPTFIAQGVPSGIVKFFRVAALDERATGGFLWEVIGRQYNAIQSDSLDEYSPRVEPSVMSGMFDALKQLPTGSAVPKQLDDEFAQTGEHLSADSLSTYILLPLTRSARIWSHWVLVPGIAFSSLGQQGIARAFLSTYSTLVLLCIVFGALFGRGLLRILCVSAACFAVARTEFLVSVPISVLEVRYLSPLFPLLDVIAFCSLWFLLWYNPSWDLAIQT
jgi:hypothetical protein